MAKANYLARIALISTLALASCKSPSYEGFVDIDDKKINCSYSDSTEYVELFDELSKVKVQYFYDKKKEQLDSIIYSQGKYATKFDRKNYPEILNKRTQDFQDAQMKYSINKSLDSLFSEKEE